MNSFPTERMNRMIFVFRISYEDKPYAILRKEILDGRLRQGWGAPGMTIKEGVEVFRNAWISNWGKDDDEQIRRRFKNISIINEISEGDYIIVPKLSKVHSEVGRYFTILRCSGDYYFSPLQPFNDFGHVIPVEVVGSYAYDRDISTEAVNAKFGGYQSPVNRSYDKKFKQAIENLIASGDGTETTEDDYSPMYSISAPVLEEKGAYLQKVVDMVCELPALRFEKLICELFEKNGYQVQDRNKYDGKGADIDIVFGCFENSSLMASIMSYSMVSQPEIRVQAKKKTGIDYNDIEGVNQLIASGDEVTAINILINMTEKFSDEAVRKAKENNVVLINGRQFAALLVRYGLDI